MPFPPTDERLLLLKSDIDRITRELYERLIARILAGESPRDVIAEMLEEFAEDVREVVAVAFSVNLGQAIGSMDLKQYKVGRFPLSEALYSRASEVSNDALKIVRAHSRGLLQARKLTLELYSGFGFQKDALDVKKRLPKYLQGPFADIQSATLATKPLRAAYLKLVNDRLKGASDVQLEKLMRVAWYERNRYFASRIARTELARAINISDAENFMSDDDLEFVQIILSAAHPVTDICDYHAGVNKYGLGPGVYPKSLAPMPPYHTHCWCRPKIRRDLSGAKWKERRAADRSFMRNLSASERAKIAGSKEKAEKILRGKKVIDVVDASKPKAFRTKLAGEYSGK